MLKTFSRIDLVLFLQIHKSVPITSLTGFDIAFTNAEDTLKQRRNKVLSTLIQRWTAALHQRCAMFKIRRWILFHFQRRINVIFNVDSQR